MNLQKISISKVAPSEIPMELLLLADPSEKMIKKYLFDSQALAAKVDERVIGAIVIKERGRNAEIMNVAVQENLQSQGIGSRLIRKAIAYAQEKGMQTLTIGTADTSKEQLRLYQSLGFQIARASKNYFLEHYDEPIYENGSQAKDRIILEMHW